jgi:hypothetical protein
LAIFSRRHYPTLDAFRNATGEPGWVAARTVGTRIDLQPAASSHETLHHELLHVLVETHAAPGLPVWFPKESWNGWPIAIVAQRSPAGSTTPVSGSGPIAPEPNRCTRTGRRAYPR